MGVRVSKPLSKLQGSQHNWMSRRRATGQDEAMPAGLPEAALETIHGRFTDEQRKGIFKPEVSVAATASVQEDLPAYTGRQR